MLRNALRKDLLLNTRHFWGIAPWFIWVAYAMGEPGAGRMTAVGGALIGSLTAATIGAVEDKLRTTATVASLPVTRRALVASRYVLASAVGVATYLMVVAMAAGLPWSVQSAADLVEPRIVLLMLTLGSVAIAVLMPLIVRFGLLGVVVFLGFFQLLGVVLMVAFEFFGSRSLRTVFGAIEGGIVSLYRALGQPAAILETAVAVVLAVWLSFRLSVFLYERRDL